MLKPDGRPYTVFTPFNRAWKAQPLPAARAVLAAPGSLPEVSQLDRLPIPVELTLTILRDGQQITLNVTLGERPSTIQ